MTNYALMSAFLHYVCTSGWTVCVCVCVQSEVLDTKLGEADSVLNAQKVALELLTNLASGLGDEGNLTLKSVFIIWFLDSLYC